jgi:Ca-activated chloride channel homolog
MSFQYPVLLVVAAAVGICLAVAYRWLQRQRSRSLARAGLMAASGGLRRHLPPLLFLAALVLLLVAVARPQATIGVPRASGTVILAFDVSNSMAATDVAPTRLRAAQSTAAEFVRSQPDTVDIGVVAFSQGALATHQPTNDHRETIDAIDRLRVAGGTSLGQAILAALTAIVGQSVSLPDPASGASPPNLGYWGSATIVLLTDGEETGGPDPVAAAELAAGAGVRVETVGVGTVDGTTVEVDGFQLATSLDEALLTEIAGTARGSYHRAQDAEALGAVYKSLELRTTAHDEAVELTGPAVAIAILLLTIGGLLMVHWYGRIL